jgi:hypothetical protein
MQNFALRLTKEVFMLLRFLLVALLIGLFSVPAQAGLDIGPYPSAPEDVEMFILSTSEDAPERVGVGLCGGTLALLTYKSRLVAELISPCVLGATTYEGEADPATLIGFQVIKLMGVRAGVFYNHSDTSGDDTVVYGLGLSLTDLGARMAGTGLTAQ